MGPERGTFRAEESRCGSTARGLVARFAGSGPPFRVAHFESIFDRTSGRVRSKPIVVGLESLRVQLGYGDLHVVHSERKFQSHPTVPPGRLIELNLH